MTAFTVSEIAQALAVKRMQVHRWLSGFPASGLKVVAGKAANAWAIGALPVEVRQKLETTAKARHYLNAEAMLAAPPKRWEPPLPVGQIAPEEIESARKLREAMRLPIARRNDCSISAAELQEFGLREYARVFGHAIKEWTWQRLFKRTLERDGAAEDFDRLEIYLDERPRRAAIELPADHPTDFSLLQKVIDGFQEPPSDGDLVTLWHKAFVLFEETSVESGPRAAKRDLLTFLFNHAGIAKSESSLRRTFDLKYAKWIEAGRKTVTLRDGRRQERAIERQFTADDVDLITHLACKNHRGEISPAVWEAHGKNGLSTDLDEWLSELKKKRRAIPESLRECVRNKVRMAYPHYMGPRYADRLRPYIERDPEKIRSMYCLNADDLTPPIVSYVPDGKGWYRLVRGQVLGVIDFRSWCMMGWCLSPFASYNSLQIREVFNTIIREEGVPHFLYLENGVWRNSHLIVGSGPRDPLSDNDFEEGLGALGLKFIHARKPEAKLIEGVWDRLQDRMSGLPGFVGREERKDRPDRITKQEQAVKSRKAHPGEFFYSFEDYPEESPHRSQHGSWDNAFQKVCLEFNNTPLFGRYHNGLTPEQVFEAAKPKDTDSRDKWPVRFGPEHQWMFGHCVETTVKERTGISLKIRGETYRYFGEQTSAMIGQRVRAWFDFKHPESIAVTDLNNRNPFIVDRANAVAALDAGDELDVELSRAAAHASESKELYRHLTRKFAPTVRTMLYDRNALAVSRAITQEREKAIAREREQLQRKSDAQRIAAEIGLPIDRASEIAGNTEDWNQFAKAKRALKLAIQAEKEGSQ